MKKAIASYILLLGTVFFFLSALSSCSISTGAATNSVSSFTLVASWTGSAGEDISSVYFDGVNVYGAAGSDGLYIFNSSLGFLASFSTNIYPIIKDVVVKTYAGVKYAVVALGLSAGSGGVMTINVNSLTNISITNTSVFTGLNPNAIVVNDDMTNIFTADQSAGFKSYTNSWDSVSGTNKTANLLSPGSDIALFGTRAFVAAKTGGVYIIDYAVNNGIQANISSKLLIANAVAVSASGDTLAVGDYLGLILFNMANPDSVNAPRYLGGYYGTPVYDVLIDGNDYYLALGASGVAKLTYSASAFTLAKQYSDGAFYSKIFFKSSTGYIYAACGKGGIRILK